MKDAPNMGGGSKIPNPNKETVNHNDENRGKGLAAGIKSKNSSSGVKKTGSAANAKGFDADNNKYKQNQKNEQGNGEDPVGQKINDAKVKGKKAATKKVISEVAHAYNPAVGLAADKIMETEKGDQVVEEFAKGDTPQEGVKNVAKFIAEDTKQTKKEINKIQLIMFCLPLLLILLIVFIFKNTDSQQYSNKNHGDVDANVTEEYDPLNPSVFEEYPGLYQKVQKAVDDAEKIYIKEDSGLEIDKYLIIATLVAPIENNYFKPIYNDKCSPTKDKDGNIIETGCYLYEGEYYNWNEFLELWTDQAKYLSKAMVLTNVSQGSPSDYQAACSGKENTMSQYAKNDLKVGRSFAEYIFIWNWFKSYYYDKEQAELNAKCVDGAPLGNSYIPTIYEVSKSRGTYDISYDEDGKKKIELDYNSGGVYYWNLINQGGFIDTYFTPYLNNDESLTPEERYEKNFDKIIEIADYIYTYYEGIRQDCFNYDIIDASIEKIKVIDPGASDYYEVDFEDQYVGGVMLAEYSGGNDEARKAFAILARTEAIAIVGVDGEGVIENSSNAQNYSKNYSPEKYPQIAKAVEETRGMVLTHAKSYDIWHTEYDCFCPIDRKLQGGFWYLPKGQHGYPISQEAFEQATGRILIDEESHWLDCPCFEQGERPTIEYTQSSYEPPTFEVGYPKQTTKANCWTYQGETDQGSAWKYKASGGHGRGASQYGMTYFCVFGYDWEALNRLWFKDAVVRRLKSSVEDNEQIKHACSNKPVYSYDDEGCLEIDGITYIKPSDGTKICKNGQGTHSSNNTEPVEPVTGGEDYAKDAGDKGKRTYKTVTINGRTYDCWRQGELADIPYGGSNLKDTGCSVVAMATAASGFIDIDVREAAKVQSKYNGAYRSFEGIMYALDQYGLAHKGPYYYNSNDHDEAKIQEMMKTLRAHFAEGKPAIALQNCGGGEGTNHFVTLLGESDGKLIMSNNFAESTDLHDYINKCMKGGRKGVLLVG